MASVLELALATGNKGKLSQFNRQAGDLPTFGVQPLFDEEKIKREINVSPLSGVDYVAQISRTKFHEQRSGLINQEGQDKDYAIIVSDSVVMLNTENGGYEAVNRDGLNESEIHRALTEINKEKKIRFVGSTTFGRKNGQSVFTTLTYLDVPLGDTVLDHFPIDISEIPELAQGQDFHAGHIKFRPTPEGFVPEFTEVKQDKRFNEVRPFISGLTSESIQTADKVARFDKMTSEIIERMIVNHPFNTTAFYSLYNQLGGIDIREFYNALIERRKEVFEKYGGNCTFFSLELCDQLREIGLDPKIIIYPSFKPNKPNGHSGVFTQFEDISFFFDPGLTIPFAVPVIPNMSLYPVNVGEKNVLAAISDMNKDSIPDLILHKPSGGLIHFTANESITPEEFRMSVPDILTDFHNLRKSTKMDYHDLSGQRIIGFTVDREQQKVTVRTSNGDVLYPMQTLKSQGLPDEYYPLCRANNVPIDSINEVLMYL